MRLLSGAWDAALGYKYHRLILAGSAGKYNYLAWISDGLHPIFTQGFLPPPNSAAVSAWEDPTYLLGKMKTETPYSLELLKRLMRLMLMNLRGMFAVYGSHDFGLPIAALLSYALLPVCREKRPVQGMGVFYPLSTLILYSMGLLLFHVEERYVWINLMLLSLMAGHILNIFLKKSFLALY